eukprot:scpid10084/ scgid25161/ Ras GTPase-activating-like protein IQGAP1; p195
MDVTDRAPPTIGKVHDAHKVRMSGSEMDAKRKEHVAYEYLCHLEEARKWFEACLGEEQPPASEMEAALMNGVTLAKLAHFFDPDSVSLKKIYDIDLSVFSSQGLKFRHTDNINFWTNAMSRAGLPKIFYPTTTDIYNRKNMPRAVYCLHALSMYLHRLGKAPPMQNLVGEAEFTEEEITNMQLELEKYGIQMPAFGKIGGILANELSVDEAAVHAAVLAINAAIDQEDAEELSKKLNLPAAGLFKVDAGNAADYLALLKERKDAKIAKSEGKSEEDLDAYEKLLSQGELQTGVSDANQVVVERIRSQQMAATSDQVNTAIRADCSEEELAAILTHPECHLQDVLPENMGYYKAFLDKLRAEKGDEPLTFDEIQQAIRDANAQAAYDRSVGGAMDKLNRMISAGDSDSFLESLQSSLLELKNVRPENAHIYQVLLKQVQEAKGEDLAREEIQSVIDNANEYADQTATLIGGLDSVHTSLGEDDPQAVLEALQAEAVSFRSVVPECQETYQERLREALAAKAEAGDQAGWTEETTLQGHSYYHNRQTGQRQWTRPEEFSGKSADLTRQEIQHILTRVTGDYNRQKLLEANEHLIVQLQALWRGILFRRGFNKRMNYLEEQVPHVVKIQSNFKGRQQHKKYAERLAYLKANEPAVITMQAYMRGSQARKLMRIRKQFFNDHVAAVVKLQSHVRRWLAMRDYRKLIQAKKPPVNTLRKFLHLLEHSDQDFQEEMEVQRLKAKVVTEIRGNKELEENLNIMDIKIGLLVKNRLTLDDVVSQSKKLKKKGGQDPLASQSRGLKSLSKENRARLEGYQHLFYLLQTNPDYLARLIFEMPQTRTTKFMESVILTIFNYASNQREEFLLMKLFEAAMKFEMMMKVDRLVDVITGNPTVVKMAVHFNRGAQGQSSLKELLLPLVRRVIDDRDLNINTNPVDVYKMWINKREGETGESCNLPYEVSNDQALDHKEVRDAIAMSVKVLKSILENFVKSITESVNKIPYGMRFVAMKLRQSLQQKFPDASREEVLKAVGNLIYYRFMNPALVAPDAFDIVELSVDKGLTPEQRRNLGSIAKVLQHAAANKAFTAENAALAPLNSYITEAHPKFLNFFHKASTVDEADVHYNQDQYAEVVTLTRPIIYISVKEIVSTHELLIEHENELAPDPNDQLHIILKEIGAAPELKDILGDSVLPPATNTSEAQEQYQEKLTEASQQEVSLMLTSRFDVTEDDDTDMKTLFVRTKRMVVDVLSVQPGENLKEVLDTPAAEEQELEYQMLVKKRDDREERRETELDTKEPEKEKLMRQATVRDQTLPLDGLKRKVMRNLQLLESEGMVGSENKFQEIVDAIARDIRNQHRHRQQRKRELAKLRSTLESLAQKAKFFEDQSTYYHEYVKACLENLARKSNEKSKQKITTIRYTAQRLQQKGVILEIEGLPVSQFRNVNFEIHSTEVGRFEVSAKFMGVSMEKVELVFQDLLQLQYEGVAVMKMFGRAKINVNLLIFLINKKFYGK